MRTVTVVVLVALIAVGMDMAWALRSPRKKPGACPKVRLGTAGICVERCSGDNSCPKKMKCCSTDCGHICLQPVFHETSTDSPVADGVDDDNQA
uniref:WAP four-disulfide core domain protein 18-like n=1 Tax=Jaculus jaculus TaxID=51337 RepID=UPI001E1B3855|nr:WAP four-disulfide core domain protein 18-like [Jaculus jaculus]